jgi:uncharacterized protein (TIGR02118 family)
MATLSVVYPRQPDGTFDLDYYRSKHLPLVSERWADAGLLGGGALIGQTGADGSDPPYFAIGMIDFESTEAIHAALAGEHAAEIIADIGNFTNVQPVIQINERIAP